MPGLDESDLIAFMRVFDAPPSDIAVRAAGFIETVQDKIKGYEAHIVTVPEDRLLYDLGAEPIHQGSTPAGCWQLKPGIH